MKTTKFGEVQIYTSPQAEILRIEPESVLCDSIIKDQVTGSTGSNWGEGPDAEW